MCDMVCFQGCQQSAHVQKPSPSASLYHAEKPRSRPTLVLSRSITPLSIHIYIPGRVRDGAILCPSHWSSGVPSPLQQGFQAAGWPAGAAHLVCEESTVQSQRQPALHMPGLTALPVDSAVIQYIPEYSQRRRFQILRPTVPALDSSDIHPSYFQV